MLDSDEDDGVPASTTKEPVPLKQQTTSRR